MARFEYLEGKRFCIVFVKVLDVETEKVSLQCFRGRANVERGQVHVVQDSGAMFTVPASATPNIMPSDGTKILKDAEYFVLVKADENVQFMSSN